MSKIKPFECLTSDMLKQDRKERRANYTRGFNQGKKQGALEELKLLLVVDSNMDISLGLDAIDFIEDRIKELEK